MAFADGHGWSRMASDYHISQLSDPFRNALELTSQRSIRHQFFRRSCNRYADAAPRP